MGPNLLDLIGCGGFGPCQLGKWEEGSGREPELSGGIGIILKFAEDL